MRLLSRLAEAQHVRSDGARHIVEPVMLLVKDGARRVQPEWLIVCTMRSILKFFRSVESPNAAVPCTAQCGTCPAKTRQRSNYGPSNLVKEPATVNGQRMRLPQSIESRLTAYTPSSR